MIHLAKSSFVVILILPLRQIHIGAGIFSIPYLSCNVFTNTKCLAMTGLEPAQIATGLEPAMFRSKL